MTCCLYDVPTIQNSKLCNAFNKSSKIIPIHMKCMTRTVLEVEN